MSAAIPAIAADHPASDFRVDRRADIGQRCLRILVDTPAGAVLASFVDSRRVREASYLTVQLDADLHLALEPAFLEYVNHSCAPNVAFDMAQLALVALLPLHAGDELTYCYPTTEWTMSRPFTCHCGAKECLGEVDGASVIGEARLARYALSPFVQRCFESQRSRG